MKDYINRLARGCFEYEPPVIFISDNHIEKNVSCDEDFIGEFTAGSADGRSIKGVVYSDNSLVAPVNPVFDGENNVIRYKVNTRGIQRGTEITGRFDIVSSGGEQSVYYSFRTGANTIASSMGEIHNLFHFTNLVQTEADEAKKLFKSDRFEDVFIKDDNRLRNIYRMIKPCMNTDRSIEEFLISIHKKSPVVFGISSDERSYEDIKDNRKDSVTIAKGTWGYADIRVSCDNDFVIINNTHIGSDMFVGNKYELEYIIDISKCHAGKNYAVICFDSIGQHLELKLSVNTGSSRDVSHMELNREIYNLTRLYVDFRLKKVNIITWLRKSLASIEKIRSIDDGNIFYKLFHAQLLMASKKREEAGWLIEYSGAGIDRNKKGGDILYAYFLYLSSMYRHDRIYTREALMAVRRIFEEGGECWQILWVLMYLDDEYEKNKTLKLASIKEQFYKGCKSPVMYLEALIIFNEQPVLLRVFDEFELQVLNFGVKNEILSEKLAAHVGELADIKKSPSGYFTSLLKKIYDKTGSRIILSSICKNLIRNEIRDEKSFVWYERAVDAQLRLTNLYEYYLMSCYGKKLFKLPKMILMYFNYNNPLDYNVKSFLYASVITNKTEDDQTYENYRGRMKSFVIDQVIKSRINDNLAIIYRELLEPSMVKKDMAEGLFGILFTYKLTCSRVRMARVYVKHKEYDTPLCYSLTNGSAFIRIYTEDAVIVFEDAEGSRYVNSVEYTLERLFDESDYIIRLMQFIPENMWLKLYLSEKSSQYGLSLNESITNMKEIMADGNINIHTRMIYVREIIDYYYNEYDGYELEEGYINIDLKYLSSKLRMMMIETYMINGCFETALSIIREYGLEGCNPRRVLRTCNYLIDKKGFEPDEDILKLCTYAFEKGKYDSDVLKYLVRYYNGSTKKMTELWKAAGDFELERNVLDERLLTQMMFVHSCSGRFEKIFEDYYNSGAVDRIVEAYLGYNSYNYFVRDTIISSDVFKVIEYRLLHDEDVLMIARLALLRYYSEAKAGNFNGVLAQKLLNEMCGLDMVFAFYHKFKGKLKLPYNVRGMTVVEYVANPDTHVLIHYVLMGADGGREYMVEEMKMVYEGMFVRYFVLFYGESIQYYITEEKDGEIRHTESHILVCEEMNPDISEGRYEMINDMLASRALNDDATFDKLLHGYAVADYVAKEVFKPL